MDAVIWVVGAAAFALLVDIVGGKIRRARRTPTYGKPVTLTMADQIIRDVYAPRVAQMVERRHALENRLTGWVPTTLGMTSEEKSRHELVPSGYASTAGACSCGWHPPSGVTLNDSRRARRHHLIDVGGRPR